MQNTVRGKKLSTSILGKNIFEKHILVADFLGEIGSV